MEAVIVTIVERYRSDEAVVGILAYYNKTKLHALTDSFEVLLTVITRDDSRSESLFHYIREGSRIQERWMCPEDFEQWALHLNNGDAVRWIIEGEILLDKNAYLDGFKNRLAEFPEALKEQKLLFEFSHFIRNYLQSKDYLAENHLLDSYGNILDALQHWARIAIIEQGMHPEVTVWEQIKAINLGVYKLYEELTTSKESMELRLQLVLLACEFWAVSKMESCCRVLIQILESREEPWSIIELRKQPELADVRDDLSLLLGKLVQKSLVKEVAVLLDDGLSQVELQYIKNKPRRV